MRPCWRGTLLYPASLVALFLSLQGLLGVAGVPPTQQASLAAAPSVAAMLISLPWRLRRTWGVDRPWQQLGVVRPVVKALHAFLRGLTKAAALLFGVVAVLLLSGHGSWQGRITTGDLANAIALMLLVGFAEELLFRGWLWGELELLTGRQRAIGIQAAVFALVHPWYQLPPVEAIALLVGLVLLGLALALQRRADNGMLWGSIGLHGGLVGGWFALQAGLITLPGTSPTWLLGAGGANPNPISGLLGWAGLGAFILIRRRWWR